MIKRMNLMLFLSVLLCLLAFECNFFDNDDSERQELASSVLVNFQLITTTPLSVQDLNQYLQFMINILDPYGVDLSPILSFTTYDVNIYKITYRVTYKGEERLASSGFLCSAADYIGYCEGNEVFHPYHHAASIEFFLLFYLQKRQFFV
ncbi:MAG: hypothetical protein JSV88_28160 [Candidatus Aminicenantes bacterium]|nr:MAG: hypothetical protein JSV88_28160 [Candidatus Aminicenantes bacterium]